MPDIILEKIKAFSDDQYGNDNRLNARFQIYDYCKKKSTLQEWIFDNLDFSGVSDVLDLGCGNGMIWRKNIEHLPENVYFTLSDLSEGMVNSAKEELKHDNRFKFSVTDACKTPFPSNHYQIVIANHMLYYFEDKNQVFNEITRLLTNDGIAYASTLSTENFHELFNIADDFDKRLVFDSDDIVRNFSLENGEKILSGHFDVTDRFIYENNVIITRPEPLLLYLASCFHSEQLELMVDRFEDFRKHVVSVISRSEQLRITNKVVLFRFRKKR